MDSKKFIPSTQNSHFRLQKFRIIVSTIISLSLLKGVVVDQNAYVVINFLQNVFSKGAKDESFFLGIIMLCYFNIIWCFAKSKIIISFVYDDVVFIIMLYLWYTYLCTYVLNTMYKMPYGKCIINKLSDCLPTTFYLLTPQTPQFIGFVVSRTSTPYNAYSADIFLFLCNP